MQYDRNEAISMPFFRAKKELSNFLPRILELDTLELLMQKQFGTGQSPLADSRLTRLLRPPKFLQNGRRLLLENVTLNWYKFYGSQAGFSVGLPLAFQTPRITRCITRLQNTAMAMSFW